VRVSLEVKESSMDDTDHTDPLADQAISTTTAITVRRMAGPVRLTLASELGGDLDGAWWPRTASVARELPELIDALRKRLGQIIDIAVNWSSLDGVPDLDSLNRHGVAAVPGWVPPHQRVMTITGSRARANLLVVPCRTTTALAVMVLRQAAALPILPVHLDTQAFRTADGIVRAARAESALRAKLAQSST
jgi:Family of unknown function (DUF5994)